jgi:uncharacterized protein (UPF0332 family)
MNDKIDWCLDHGMKLIIPNDNLAEEYYRNAEETLFVANLSKSSGSNMWLATHKYYTEYLAAYALLMKIGVKSEIHSCTIEIIHLLEDMGVVDFGFSSVLDADKDLRIDNQYYLKDIHVDFDSVKLSVLLLRVRKILDVLSQGQIIAIRNVISGKIYK